MKNNTFKGVMTPLLIPMDKQENVIESELRAHINNLIGKGVHGFLSPSSTGEFANLPIETREKILTLTVDEVNGRLPVVALIGECGTKATLHNIARAAAIGADAVMATPPYYYPLDQNSLLTHFQILADKGGLPLWLYHQPNDTKLSIEHSTLLKLSKHPNIAGVKVSTSNMLYYHRVVRQFQPDHNFTVLMGEDHSFLPALSIGGDGVVSFLSNIVPEVVVILWTSIREGNLTRAKEAQNELMDSFEAFFTLPNHNPISACKLILQKRGLFSNEISSAPFPVLSDEDSAVVLRRARDLGLC